MKANSDRKTNPSGYISAVPSPDPAELKIFYEEQYYQAPQSSSYRETYDELEIRYKQLKCDALIFAVQQAGLAGGKFLDIGAGEGFLLNAAMSRGFEVTGLDFSAYGVGKFFPELLPHHVAGDVYESLAQLKLEGQTFQACSATNVLEHVIDPDVFLDSVRQIMAPDGVFVITVPNDFSETQKLATEEKMIDREFWFVPPHHLHYFNSQSLLAYLDERGFRLVDAFSDFPVDLYLLHSGSNYIMDPVKGKEANRARMLHDLMIIRAGMAGYLDYYRAMFNVGIGRNVTAIVRKK